MASPAAGDLSQAHLSCAHFSIDKVPLHGLGYRIITLNGDERYWIFFPISNTPKSSNSLWLIADADTDVVIYFQTTSRLSCAGINIFVLCSQRKKRKRKICSVWVWMQDRLFICVSSCLYSPHTGTLAGCLLLQKVQLCPFSQSRIYSDLCVDFIRNLNNTIKDLLCFLREYTINTCSCCVHVLKVFSYQQKYSFWVADILLYITKEFVQVTDHENKYQQKVITFQKIEFCYVVLFCHLLCVKMCFIPGYFDYKTDYRRINNSKWISFKKQLDLI